VKYHLKILSQRNLKEVNQLRIEAYGRSTSFRVKQDGFLWNDSDDQSIVVGLYHQQKLISSMRGEIISSKELVEQKIECQWDFNSKLLLPSMMLSKASTSHTYSGQGLHSLLRLFFLHLAKRFDIKQMIGTMTADTSRLSSMRDMGYLFFENILGWSHQDYHSLQKVLVAVLDIEKNGKTAITKLSKKHGRDLNVACHKINPKLIQYKEVTVVR